MNEETETDEVEAKAKARIEIDRPHVSPRSRGWGSRVSLVSPRVAALLPQPFDNRSTVRRFEALWGKLLPLCLSNDYAAH